MKKIIYFAIVLLLSVRIDAGDPARKGTSGASQLLIPVGAKSIATGGAFLANVTGVEALYYNPGGLSKMQGTEAMFSYMNYIADINVSYLAIGTQLGIGSFAFSYKTLDFGDIPVTTIENPDGTGRTYSPNYIVAGLSYSTAITDRVSAGTTVKVISETIENINATGVALDIGIQYDFQTNLALGVTVKNIGTNMKYSGENLKTYTDVPGGRIGSGSAVYEVDTEEFQIPSYFELSIAYRFDFNVSNNLQIASAFRNNNNFEDMMKFGLEYSFMEMFHLRAGYNLNLENADESIYNFTFGAGLNYRLIEGIRIGFDYAFRSVDDFPTDNHVFTLTLGIN